MFENLIKKYFVLTDIELNLGSGGQRVGVDQIAGIDYEVVKQAFGAAGSLTLVSPASPLPVTDAVAEAALASIAAEDFATQTTLAALLAKVIAAPSTEAKQDAMIALLTTIAAITQPLTNTQLRATPVPVSGTISVTKAATSAVTVVNDSATNVTILAANANRLGATVYNDSTEILYLKLGATAVIATSFSVRMLPNDYYEVPFGYVGIIDGIWANNASGSAKITELTA